MLTYQPDTGLFVRNVDVGNCAAGTIAGSPNRAGYIRISVDDRSYRAHVLAWFYVKGEWPINFIDHHDLNKSNNRWVNIRPATKSNNHANRPALATSKSGLKGAYFCTANGKWHSTIKCNGKNYHLGYFATAEEANAAYLGGAERLHREFARGK